MATTTWTGVPCNVHAFGFDHNPLRELLLAMLGAEAGDPTACAGPRAGAAKLWNVDMAVFLEIGIESFELSEKFAFPALGASWGLRLGVAYTLLACLPSPATRRRSLCLNLCSLVVATSPHHQHFPKLAI